MHSKRVDRTFITRAKFAVATLAAVFLLASPAVAAPAPVVHGSTAVIAVKPDVSGWMSYGWFLNLETCQETGSQFVAMQLALYYRCDYGERIGLPSWQLWIYVINLPQ